MFEAKKKKKANAFFFLFYIFDLAHFSVARLSYNTYMKMKEKYYETYTPQNHILQTRTIVLIVSAFCDFLFSNKETHFR